MKTKIYLLFSLVVLVLIGCSKKEQMPDFIPTPIPTDETNVDTGIDTPSVTEGVTPAETEETNDTPIVVGKTTTKYVKMKEYNDYLNVRSEPSMDGKVVGFLVHTEKIEVTKIENGWACFVLNNKYCYVSADYLVDVRPEYIAPPTPTPSPIPTNTPAPTSTPTPKPGPDLTAPPEI